MGRHLLSLQWISDWKSEFGEAVVTESAGAMRLHGRQEGRGEQKGDLLTIEGVIVSVDKRSFVMDGEVVTRVSYMNGGEPCRRRGRMELSISGRRHYWRLQDMNNPCDDGADYVDVFLRDARG